LPEWQNTYNLSLVASGAGEKGHGGGVFIKELSEIIAPKKA
jgi:hypothetical protein